jgi:hypothetical protein
VSPRRAVTRRVRVLDDLRPLQRIELGIGPKRQCSVAGDADDRRRECNIVRWFPGEPEEPARCHVVSSAFQSEQQRLEAWHKVRDDYMAHWEAAGRLHPPWAERVLTPLLCD